MKFNPIPELQKLFDQRRRIDDALMAMKCYPEKSSVFFSYTDGWKNKKYANLPIPLDELKSILGKQIDTLNKEIERVIAESQDDTKFVVISNENELIAQVNDYRTRYPHTYTDLDTIRERIAEIFKKTDHEDSDHDGLGNNYQIEVCSDWQDKVFCFKDIDATDDVITVEFTGIVKG